MLQGTSKAKKRCAYIDDGWHCDRCLGTQTSLRRNGPNGTSMHYLSMDLSRSPVLVIVQPCGDGIAYTTRRRNKGIASILSNPAVC